MAGTLGRTTYGARKESPTVCLAIWDRGGIRTTLTFSSGHLLERLTHEEGDALIPRAKTEAQAQGHRGYLPTPAHRVGSRAFWDGFPQEFRDKQAVNIQRMEVTFQRGRHRILFAWTRSAR